MRKHVTEHLTPKNPSFSSLKSFCSWIKLFSLPWWDSFGQQSFCKRVDAFQLIGQGPVQVANFQKPRGAEKDN